jgi:nucleoside-diphosphate-sugar epimerase
LKVLVTGSKGYIGTVLTKTLLNKGYDVIGLDSGYFKNNVLGKLDEVYHYIEKDVRDININDLNGVESIIHLAGLSNDPLGEFSPSLTEDINFKATKKLAVLAKKAGVSRFVYASSQSMYGISKLDVELDEDNSAKKPITAYAKAKWNGEKFILKLNSSDFSVVCFRPSTVFGASSRLRCDVVFNNLVACAFTTGKIEIKSDGSPWRPVVHVRDVCAAFISGIEAPNSLISGESFNVGIKDGNYTVRQLAEAAQKAVPNSVLTFTNEHTDPRTYKVSFKKILTRLSSYYQPEWDLKRGGKELVDFFNETNFTEKDFRSKSTIRLEQLQYLNNNEYFDNSLRFK